MWPRPHSLQVTLFQAEHQPLIVDKPFAPDKSLSMPKVPMYRGEMDYWNACPLKPHAVDISGTPADKNLDWTTPQSTGSLLAFLSQRPECARESCRPRVKQAVRATRQWWGL